MFNSLKFPEAFIQVNRAVRAINYSRITPSEHGRELAAYAGWLSPTARLPAPFFDEVPTVVLLAQPNGCHSNNHRLRCCPQAPLWANG
jgi:hypothetical protein